MNSLSSGGHPVGIWIGGVLLSLFLLIFCGGDLTFWSLEYPVHLPYRTPLLAILLALLVGWFGLLRPNREQLLFTFSCTLLLLFFSGWLTKPFSLLQGPVIRGEVLLFSFLSTALWSHRNKLLYAGGIATVLGLIICFTLGSEGRPLFSDDNPTFFYRLALLKEHFPSIPFYNPLWNGGIDARDFFATGALNAFFLFSPIIYTVDLFQNYNSIVLLLLFVVCPFSTYIAARIVGLAPTGATVAGVLSVSSSLLWYRWALQFGTMGFITSTSLLPLVLALGSRFFKEEQVSLRLSLATVIIVSLMLFWTPAGIACFPLIALGLIQLKKLYRQRWWLPVVALLLCLHLPWVSLFWSVSNVSSFLDKERAETKTYAQVYSEKGTQAIKTTERVEEPKQKKQFKHNAKPFSIKEGLKHFREAVHSANPLLWTLIIPGLLFLTGPYQLIVALTLGWLALLGSFGPLLKPQLELDRMLVIALFLSAVPVGAAFEQLLKEERMKLLSALAVGFLFAGTYSSGAVVRNRSVVPISYAGADVTLLPNFIKTFAGDGRTVFSGFILHDFSGGHLAPLPLLSGRPIVASSPVHNLWRYKQVFPKEYISRKDEGINEYLNLMNASLIFAHEPKWRKYFQERSDTFKEVGRIGRFTAFQRPAFQSSYFLEGEGSVNEQTTHTVTFQLQTPEAILKFQYFPFVEVKGCDVSPAPISDSITFLKLTNCKTNTPLILQSVSPVERWKLGYGLKG